MKTYKITEGLSITPEGHFLKFELDKARIHVADDDVSRILNGLIDITYSPDRPFDPIKIELQDSGNDPYSHNTNGTVEISHYSPNECYFSLTIVSPFITSKLGINERWVLVKLANVLTALLPGICEEG